MLNILVAPIKSVARAQKVTRTIVKYLKEQNVEYSVYFSLDHDDMLKNVKELHDNGEFEFVIVGDDIMLNKFVNYFKDLSKIKFGIIPVGKKCDFANCLGVESKPIKSIQRILNKEIQLVDYLQINDRRVLNNLIIGASVETAIAYEQYRLKNFFSKKFAEINHGQKFNGVDLSLRIKNEKNIEETIFELIVANAGYSEGKNVSPLANMSDGLFNISYSTAEEAQDKKRFVKDMNEGKHIYDDRVVQLWTDNLKITNDDKKIKALVDGVYDSFDEINVAIVENGLKIYK
ncbi:MAG: diacylglycerol/lipid kinase family protein [Clostridia bacterium]